MIADPLTQQLLPVQGKCSRKRLTNICLSKNDPCASPSLPLFIGSLYSGAERSTGHRHLSACRGTRWWPPSHNQPCDPPRKGPRASGFSAITGDHKPVRGETQAISHWSHHVHLICFLTAHLGQRDGDLVSPREALAETRNPHLCRNRSKAHYPSRATATTGCLPQHPQTQKQAIWRKMTTQDSKRGDRSATAAARTRPERKHLQQLLVDHLELPILLQGVICLDAASFLETGWQLFYLVPFPQILIEESPKRWF